MYVNYHSLLSAQNQPPPIFSDFHPFVLVTFCLKFFNPFKMDYPPLLHTNRPGWGFKTGFRSSRAVVRNPVLLLLGCMILGKFLKPVSPFDQVHGGDMNIPVNGLLGTHLQGVNSCLCKRGLVSIPPGA